MHSLKFIILFLLVVSRGYHTCGQVGITPIKVDSLKAAIVSAVAVMRPRMKTDTVEFNTAHIRMQPNATVEELLARLPGLQIDANGNITYNGEKISHLLVDGEDFLGSDPTIVTRNFDASRIDKVQIVDRKSDQAIFTGIDDGARVKTLNVVLKEESKNGYFGKGEGGADLAGIYSVNGLLADFQKREQIAGLGFASNTGSTGFSSDYGRITGLTGDDDALGASAGNGIPQFLGVALHFANTWNGSGDHVNGNYQYSHLITQPVTTSYVLQALPDSVYGQYQYSHSINKQDQHWAYGTYDYNINARSAINTTFRVSTTEAQNQYGDTALSTFNSILANSSLRNIEDNVSRQSISESMSYRMRGRRHPQRVLTFRVGATTVNSSTNGYLYSIDRYYQSNSSSESGDTTDQRKQIANQSLALRSTLTYAEPLWHNTQLGMTYEAHYTSSNILSSTYDKANGKYDLYVDSLSSHLQGHNLNQYVTLNLQGGNKWLSYTTGIGIQQYAYREKDLLVDSISRYRYLNTMPYLRIIYSFDPMTRVLFQYSGSSQEPTITQLQPVINNSNPLLITLGNPSLRPGFNQSWKLTFSKVRSWMYDVTIDFGLVDNAISTKTNTDSLGRQISQPVNVSGGKNAGANLSVQKKMLGLDWGLNLGTTYTSGVNYIDADLNKTISYTGGGGISVGHYSADIYSFLLNIQFNYFETHSSVDEADPVHYWTQSHSGNLNFFFIRHFDIHTDLTYTWQQSTSNFAGSTSVLLWNAYMLRNLLNNRLAIKFQANNLLNANSGISRTNLANLNSQTSTNIRGRYWLLSAAYRFDHSWKKR